MYEVEDGSNGKNGGEIHRLHDIHICFTLGVFRHIRCSLSIDRADVTQKIEGIMVDSPRKDVSLKYNKPAEQTCMI